MNSILLRAVLLVLLTPWLSQRNAVATEPDGIDSDINSDSVATDRKMIVKQVQDLHQQSFSEFKKNVGDVDAKSTGKAIFGSEQDEESISAAKKELTKFYEDLPVTASIKIRTEAESEGTKARLVAFDCVPRDKQPALAGSNKAVAPERPPPETEQNSKSIPNTVVPSNQKIEVPQPISYVVHNDSAAACPPGTVPIARETLPEKLFNRAHAKPILDRQLFTQLNNLETSSLPTPQSPFVHRYAHAAYAVKNIGASARLNVWSPHVDGNDMSLSQIWVVGASDDGRGVQTVEVGWQVMSFWQSPYSTIFVYSTADNYATTGCYATRCTTSGPQTNESFVLMTNKIIVGKPIAKQSALSSGQELIEVKWIRNPNTGSWWVKVDGEWVGYYPASFFGNGQLATLATYVDFGGETAGLAPTAEMGSGHHAVEGLGKAAFQSRLRYYALDGSVKDAIVNGIATNESCYSISVNAPSAPEANSGTYIFFGGPGKSSNLAQNQCL